MKKILFASQVIIMIAALPLYFFVQADKAGKAVERNDHSQEISKTNAKLFVILKMPAAPDYQVQSVNN